jgi:hypothetical protein
MAPHKGHKSHHLPAAPRESHSQFNYVCHSQPFFSLELMPLSDPVAVSDSRGASLSSSAGRIPFQPRTTLWAKNGMNAHRRCWPTTASLKTNTQVVFFFTHVTYVPHASRRHPFDTFWFWLRYGYSRFRALPRHFKMEVDQALARSGVHLFTS